jgi:hypothetical protein
MNIETYIEKVKASLLCNCSDADRASFTLFAYTNKQVDNNIDYFEMCMDKGMSPYKSLFYFHERLDDIWRANFKNPSNL